MAIVLPGGFNITNNEPADARFSVADSSARLGLSAANVYEGLVVYQRDNDTLYVLTNASDPSQAGNWTEVDSQVDISALNTFTGSAESRLDALELETGSIANEQSLQDSRLNSLEAATSSYALEANISGAFYADSSSFSTRITNLEGVDNLYDSRLDALELETGSIATEQALQDARLDAIEAATGSLTDSGITGSSLVTASATGDTITFTKGDGSTFPVTIFTSSSLGLNTKVGAIPISSFVNYSVPGSETESSASVVFATPFSSSDYQVIVYFPNVFNTGSANDRLLPGSSVGVVNKTTTGFSVLFPYTEGQLASDFTNGYSDEVSYIAVANGETAVTSSFTLLSATASYVDYSSIDNLPTLVSSSVQVSNLTGSLITTASATGDTITFTKGDGSTFPITIFTSSSLGLNTKVGFIPSASFQPTGSRSKADVVFATPFSSSDYSVAVELVDLSYFILDLANNLHLGIENKTSTGFTVIAPSVTVFNDYGGPNSGVDYIAVANGETAVTSSFTLLSATASYVDYSSIDNLPTLISSSTQITALGFISESGVNSDITGSSLVTASSAGSTITFTKGDASTFDVSIISASYALTASHAQNLTVSGSIAGADYIDFTTTGSVPYNEGRLFYDNENGALAFYNEETEITLQIGQEFYKRVFNNTGGVISNGTPVRISGSQGDYPYVWPAISKNIYSGSYDSQENKVVGVATHNIGINEVGYVTELGVVRGIDTTAFAAGDRLYLQTGSAGFRNTPPPFPFDIIPVGEVLRSQVNGFIEVRTSDPITSENISGIINIETEVISDESVTIQKGTPVHVVSEGDGPVPRVKIAKANDSNLMPATFVVEDEIPSGSQGTALSIGYIYDVDTSAFTVGDILYVAPNGGYTNQKPTGSDLIQNLGVVLKVSATEGSGFVYGAGRSNDVPNIPENYLWIGNANGVATPVSTGSLSGSFTLLSDYTTASSSFSTRVTTLETNDTLQDLRLGALELETGSINGRLNSLEAATSSYALQANISGAFYADSSSFSTRISGLESTDTLYDSRLDALELETGSIANEQTLQDSRLNSLEVKSGSLESRIQSLETETGSIASEQSLQDARLASLESKTGSLESTDTLYDARLDSLELETGSIATEQSLQDSRLASLESKTGSLEGTDTLYDSRLNSIEAATGSYLLNTTDTLTGDLTVTGKVTAQEFHTEFVSSSIIYQSGSTKFGDTSDDTHDFTGSVNISGSINISNVVNAGTDTDKFLVLDSAGNVDFRTGAEVLSDIGGTNGTLENARLDALELETGSIASEQTLQDSRLASLESKSGSLESTDTLYGNRLNSLETETGSIATEQSLQDARLAALELETGSIASEQALQDSRLQALENKTGSLESTDTLYDARLDSLEAATSSYGTGDGTVTSVSSSGNVNGITLTGEFSTSGQLVLGGTLGSIANNQLTNSSVSYGGVSVSLGGSDATPAFNLSDATSLPIVGGTTGTLSVARGGTGATTFTSNAVLTGNGTSAVQAESNLTFDGSKLTVTGNISASGNITGSAGLFSGDVDANDFVTTSDRRLKSEITPIKEGLETLKQFVSYEYIKSDRQDAGFIAQEVQQAIPYAIQSGSGGYLTMRDRPILAHMHKAILELSERLEAIEQKIK